MGVVFLFMNYVVKYFLKKANYIIYKKKQKSVIFFASWILIMSDLILLGFVYSI
jgi:hypothetical protein